MPFFSFKMMKWQQQNSFCGDLKTEEDLLYLRDTKCGAVIMEKEGVVIFPLNKPELCLEYENENE
ncbi:hypothetical protein BEP19_05910 [Ammoniphilus oxalaticus]|uniref:Uncharacterized protein n=1 Tax=Ammoniphilus oxalaticus TaxID=66863 RepID=A0A419SIU3_9BACL|nr:hypothetical protein BEP19_05910 [Ammoniphilus oxalaticus]